MAFPLGANANVYNMLVARHPGTPVTVDEYNAAVRWINASDPTQHLAEFSGGAALPPGNLAAPTDLGTSTNQAQGTEDMMAGILNALGILPNNLGELGAAEDLFQILGEVYPGILGRPPDEWAAIIAAGGGTPTAESAYNTAMLGIQQAQLELNRLIAGNERELGLASLALQKELGYAGFDLQKELQKLSADLQRELQAAQLGWEREKWGQQFGLMTEEQQFNETMMGYKGASMPGLAGDVVPSVTG